MGRDLQALLKIPKDYFKGDGKWWKGLKQEDDSIKFFKRLKIFKWKN